MTSAALFRPPLGPSSVLAVASQLVPPPTEPTPRGGLLLAADIGATKLAAAVCGDVGVATSRVELPTGWSGSAELAVVERALRALVEQTSTPVDLVVLASAPELDGRGRVRSWPNRPHWEGLDVLGRLVRALAAPVLALDDGHAAALAEALLSGVDELLYVGLGSGVGGGQVVGGTVAPTGGLGHRVVSPAGRRCCCGRSGCLQTVASGPAVLARAAELAARPVTAPELRRAVTSGAAWAAAAVDEAGEALAAAVAHEWSRFRPAAVHIGGGFGAGFPETAAAADRALRRRRLPVHARPAVGGAAGSLLGASFLAAAVAGVATTKGALR